MALGVRLIAVSIATLLSAGSAQIGPARSPAETAAVHKELSALCERELEADRQEEAALMSYTSPALEAALKSEPAFWGFLTGDSTPYLDRLKAASRGASLLLPIHLPKLWRAMAELDPSGTAAYARAASPCSYLMSAHLTPSMWADRRNRAATPPPGPGSLTVLGRRIELPAAVDYPVTLEDRKRSPWLWQVARAVPILGGRVQLYYSDASRYPALFEVAWQWQPSNWHEARARATFLELGPRNALHVEALLRLALDPQSSGFGASQLHVGVNDTFHHEELIHAAQIVILQQTRTAEVAAQTAYGTTRLAGDTYGGPKTELRPLQTSTAILAMARWALDKSIRLDQRYHAFASGICRMVKDPPFRAVAGEYPKDAEIARRLAAFERWFEEAKDGLQEESDREKPHLRQLAAELHASIL